MQEYPSPDHWSATADTNTNFISNFLFLWIIIKYPQRDLLVTVWDDTCLFIYHAIIVNKLKLERFVISATAAGPFVQYLRHLNPAWLPHPPFEVTCTVQCTVHTVISPVLLWKNSIFLRTLYVSAEDELQTSFCSWSLICWKDFPMSLSES